MTTPTRIDIFDPANLADPSELYSRLRAEAPVYGVPGTGFHLVSSWEVVAEAAARTDDFSSHLTAVLVRDRSGAAAVFDLDGAGSAIHVLATADDPVHAEHRRLVSSLLGKRIRPMARLVDRAVDDLWSGMGGEVVEWVRDMADALPLSVVADLIGLPESDVPQLITWAYDSTEMLGGVTDDARLPQLVTSAVELAGYLRARLTDAKSAPGDDLLGLLASACTDGRLSDDVAVLILVQLVGAGGESTAGLIANAARLLADHPEVQRRVRRDRTLLDPLLDEALRLESPFRGHHRVVTRATSLAGVELSPGDHLLLMWGAANRDAAAFERPDELLLDRPNVRSHLAFGKGAHFCIGSALARMEARAAITALLDRTESFALDPACGPEWVPSLFVRRHRTLPLRLTR